MILLGLLDRSDGAFGFLLSCGGDILGVNQSPLSEEPALLLAEVVVGKSSPFPSSAARKEELADRDGRLRCSVRLRISASGARSGRLAPGPDSAARNAALAVRLGSARL